MATRTDYFNFDLLVTRKLNKKVTITKRCDFDLGITKKISKKLPITKKISQILEV